MEKPIKRRAHGLIDYAYVTAVAHLPEIVGFNKNKKATTFFRGLSSTAFASAACTRAEWGAARIIPYKKHLLLDTAISVIALAAPWLLGFAGNKKATATSVAVGVLGLGVVALSKPENMPVTKDAFEETRAKLY